MYFPYMNGKNVKLVLEFATLINKTVNFYPVLVEIKIVSEGK